MTYRERLIRTVQFQPVDELPFRLGYGLMPGVLEDWRAEGLPASVRTPADVCTFFWFPPRGGHGLPIDAGLAPPIEEKVIEETAEYRIAVDGLGRTTKVIFANASLPLAMDFPVKDARTWQDYRRRLQFSPDRIGRDLEAAAAANVAAGRANVFFGLGFFWFPCELMGSENLCLAYYEQPELVHDMLETICGLFEQELEAVLARVTLDQVSLGDNIGHHGASMIGKRIFDEFVGPYYRRIGEIVRKRGVPIFMADASGCLRELAHWFSECGVNYIPCEPQAGNDIVAYRKEFGRRMAYDAGLDKLVLTQGRAAIDRMLDRTIPFMKETGGGWSVCLDHRVVRGTPLADFRHFLDRVREMIRY